MFINICMVGNLTNIFMEHKILNILFGIKKMYNFDPYNVLLAIATKYTCAAYGWFCAPESHMSRSVLFS